MLRLPGLDQRAARPVAAPGAARHLIEQLERALGGARIAAAEAQICVHHADEREMREVVALGDELRADHNVEGALGDLVQFAPQPFGAAGKIRGEHQEARIREQTSRLLPRDARRRARRR